MLKGFYDDSGSDGQSAFCVIGGYIADVDSWNQFSADWQAVLDSAPPITYLKMREAESRRGQFWGWTEEARDKKLMEFAHVIKKHAFLGLASIVSNQAYESLVRGYLPPTVDNPYWFCFQAVVLDALVICGDTARYAEGKIDFVFDSEDQGTERRALLLHDNWRRILRAQTPEPELIGAMEFRDDKEILPLQAADMFAWHLRRYSEHSLKRCPEDRPITEVLWSIPIHMKAWHPAELINFVEFYQSIHPDFQSNQGDERDLES